MESEHSQPTAENRILEAMAASEPSEASAVLSSLLEDLRSHGVNGVNLTGLWNSFVRLLHRRGYYVETPAQLTTSLGEIEAIGEGFDLYELARNLARYDAVRMESRGLAGHRALPELKPFAPPGVAKRKRKEG